MPAAIIITLDMKKCRIRIHKTTLELLNRPKNIHILINPAEYKLVIRPTPPDIKDSLKISYKADSDCEFYSTELMEQLSRLRPELSTSRTYRIIGEIIEEKRIALFDINKAVIYDGPPTNDSKDHTRSSPNEC